MVDEEVVLNKVHTKKPQKIPLMLQEQLNASTRCLSASNENVREVEANVKVKHQRNLQMFNLALCVSRAFAKETKKDDIPVYVFVSLCKHAVRLHSCKQKSVLTCPSIYVVHALWKQHTRNLNFRFWKYANCRGGKLAFPDMISFRGGYGCL